MAFTSLVRCLSKHVRPTVCLLQASRTSSKPIFTNMSLSRSISISSALYSDKKFSIDHEWIMMDGDNGTIGITDYAQDKLGDIVFVELPEVGSTFAKEDTFGTVESVKAASDVITPVSGEVVEINSFLEGSPETVNSDPYGAGWLMKIKLSDISELDDLMSEEAYEKYLKECD